MKRLYLVVEYYLDRSVVVGIFKNLKKADLIAKEFNKEYNFTYAVREIVTDIFDKEEKNEKNERNPKITRSSNN